MTGTILSVRFPKQSTLVAASISWLSFCGFRRAKLGQDFLSKFQCTGGNLFERKWPRLWDGNMALCYKYYV